MADRNYREIIANEPVMARYAAYQQKYRATIRESDRVLIDLVRDATGGGPARVLDIGCSTGNFLYHLARAIPGLDLVGGELSESVLDANRADPDLAGIQFEHRDLLYLPADAYDVVVANAVLYLLRPEEYLQALRSVASALRPGGTFIVFDFFNPFDQEIDVREVSEVDREGQTFHFRSYAYARMAFRDSGLGEPEFRPFEIPIDLERPEDPADLTSYTVAAAEGGRLTFRGAICEPWCHAIARKAAG